MDMFSLGQKPESSEPDDGALKRHVQEAFAGEPTPTSASALLERILIKAEALPQVAPEATTELQPSVVEALDVSPSVAIQQQRATQLQRTTPQRHIRHLRHLNWQLYHQYLERPLHKTNIGSGIHL